MKLSTLFVFVLCFLTFFSCSDLQPEVESDLTTSNAYNTESDIEAALTGIYSRLDPYPGDSYLYYAGYLVMITDYATDMGHSTAAGDPTEMTNMSYDSNNRYLSSNWQNMYQVISNANKLLSEVEDVEIEQTKKNRIIGQARFLRALAYRDLTNAWGPVPLITKPVDLSDVNENQSLASVEKVDSLIIADSEFAIQHLPEEWGSGESQLARATKGAALTLLGKVYMRAHEYGQAEQYIDQVLGLRNQGVYSLNPDFQNVWSGSNKVDAGMIFGVLHQAGQNAAEITNHFGPQDHPEVTNRWQYYGVSLDFWRKYSDQDPRKEFFYYNYEGAAARDQTTDRGFYYEIPGPNENSPADTVKFLQDVATKKYSHELISNSYLDGRTISIFRLSDVILLKAEIENALNGPQAALPHINEVRQRAGVPTYGQSGFTVPSSKEEMNEAILAERGYELVFEYKRRADLIRFGKYVEITNDYLENRGLSPVVTEDLIHFPYPLSEAAQNSEMQSANSSRIPN